MPIDRILTLAQQLIRYPSLSGTEREVMLFMEQELQRRDWKVERLPVPEGGAFNLLAATGTPKIIFTTHLDIVPAPETLFDPKISDGKLYGRGACDAKGIAAVMVEAATALAAEGADDIGLLFVVDEERLSAGGKAAAPFLKERGVRFIVNGEPTDCCLVSGHKGVLTVELKFSGKSAHSGYPELGDDANAKLFRTAQKLLNVNWGESAQFGKGTANLGLCKGGVAGNVISPFAELKITARTVNRNEDTLEKIRGCSEEAAEINVKGSSEPVALMIVEGFETKPVSYGTDVPYLQKSGASCLLYGPGSIAFAHTDEEQVLVSELQQSFEGYRQLYGHLRKLS